MPGVIRSQAGLVTSDDRPVPAAHAGVVTRLLAAAVDAAVVAVVAVGVDLGVAGVRFVWSPVDFRWPQPSTPVVVLVLFVVAVVYLSAGWSLAGRTYGARLLGLRILSWRYRPLGWFHSLLRALACVLFPVGLLWSGISATRRSLQDFVVRTVVVYDVRPDVGVTIPRPRRPVGTTSGTRPPTMTPRSEPAQPSEIAPSQP